MGKYIKSFISAFCVLFFASCESEISLDLPSGEDIIILNAQLESHNSTHEIYLSYKENGTLAEDIDARLFVKINNDPQFELRYPEKGYKYLLFEFEYDFEPGDKLELYATCKGKEAKSSVVFPSALSLKPSASCKEISDDWTAAYSVDLSFQDDASSINYYRFAISYSYVLVEIKTHPSRTRYIVPCKVESDHPLIAYSLNDFESDDIMDYLIGSLTPDNVSMVFSDELISGQEVKLNAKAYPTELLDLIDPNTVSYNIVNRKLLVHIQHLSNATFNYFRSVNAGENFGYTGNLLVEPTIVPSNVEGGAGYIATITSNTTALELADLIGGGICY